MIKKRGLQHWLPTYVREAISRHRFRQLRRSQLTHIIFVVCDHYEPRHGAQEAGQAAARVSAWHSGYREMQLEIRRRFGLAPLHTWFYPPHHGSEHFSALANMAFDGLGEVELHYHHDGDTEASLRRDLKRTLADFNRAGLLLQMGTPPGRRFGFIHGDWALDNSAPNGRFCGVNSELSLLQELGCWADLTMPSSDECQTRKINSIYYAQDDPARPKSHDWGVDSQVGQTSQPGLMLIQGPLAINWRAPRYPRIENSTLTTENWGRPDRIRAWLDCHVHVRGRPDWVFVKLHTHGAIERDFSALFGERSLEMHRVLNEQFNDGRRYRMHYATARQAYNLVRAAEHGRDGNPSGYLDFELPPQVTSRYCVDAQHELMACTDEHLSMNGINSNPTTTLKMRNLPVAQMRGQFSSVVLDARRKTLKIGTLRENTPVRITWANGVVSTPGPHQGNAVTGSDREIVVNGQAEISFDFTPAFTLQNVVAT